MQPGQRGLRRGLLQGAWDAVWSTLTGLAGLAKLPFDLVFGLVRDLITGTLVGKAKELWDVASQLNPGALLEGAGTLLGLALTDFAAKWNDSDLIKRWNFRDSRRLCLHRLIRRNGFRSPLHLDHRCYTMASRERGRREEESMRRRPQRVRRSLRLTPERFDSLVQEALDALPPWVQERLRGVTVAVEDEPPSDEDADLLGLYVGDALTEETPYAAPPMVLVFQGPHERLCRTRGELRREVAETVLHEIAHHFGLEEEDLDALGPLRLPPHDDEHPA